MNFEYIAPRVRMVDGVPGYKAGEWPGIKPNKFERVKSIIRPKMKCDFINIDKGIVSYLFLNKLLNLIKLLNS